MRHYAERSLFTEFPSHSQTGIKRMAVETYVVSVYRRGEKPDEEAAGLIERASSGERQAFSSSRELWAFLCRKPGARAKKTARKRGVRKEP